MNQKTKMRYTSQKGITLIALVITIIVLLILAGVTISMVLGDDGIIAQAQQAKEANEKGTGRDEGAISQAEGVLSRYNMSKYNDVKDEAGIAKQNSTIYGEKASSSNPVIPKGFKHLTGTLVDTGFVIQDEAGNEFVWVPVDGTMDIVLDSEPATVTRYPWGDEGADANPLNIKAILEDGYENSIEGLSKQFKDEYDAMLASIKAYGGFYVGRYETGWDEDEEVVVSQAGVHMTAAQDLASVGWKCFEVNGPGNESETTKATWYGLYAKQKELYKKNSSSSVVSGMIYGCQWNAIMNWLQNLTDSELAENKVNNIYDLAGNHSEWTQEAASGYFRVSRYDLDGDGSIFPVEASRTAYEPDSAETHLSSRLQLYIK